MRFSVGEAQTGLRSPTRPRHLCSPRWWCTATSNHSSGDRRAPRRRVTAGTPRSVTPCHRRIFLKLVSLSRPWHPRSSGGARCVARHYYVRPPYEPPIAEPRREIQPPRAPPGGRAADARATAAHAIRTSRSSAARRQRREVWRSGIRRRGSVVVGTRSRVPGVFTTNYLVATRRGLDQPVAEHDALSVHRRRTPWPISGAR